MNKIFISHAVADAPVITKLQELIQLTCNLLVDDFFCTSIDGMNCKGGSFFNDDIRNNLKEANVVVAFLSPAYSMSAFCLAELGAVWISRESKLFVPIKDRDFSYDAIKAVLLGIQQHRVEDESGLFNMLCQISKACGTKIDPAHAYTKIKSFLDFYNEYKEDYVAPFSCTEDQWNELKDRCNAAEITRDSFFEKLNIAEKKINALEALKNPKEVAAINASFAKDDLDQFDQLVAEFNTIASKYFSWPVKKFLVYSYFKLNGYDVEDVAEYQKALQEDVLEEGDGAGYFVNETNRHVRDLFGSLAEIKDFATGVSDTFINAIEEEHDVDFDLNNAECLDKLLLS